MATVIMDVILGGLLIAALMLGMRLDKKLVALRAAHEGFAKAVHDLDDAAIRAHASLKELRGHADESQDLLHGRVLAARDVLQKLDHQVARAERVQRELDKGLTTFDTLQTLRQEAARYQAPVKAPEPIRMQPIQAPEPAPRVESSRNDRRPFDRDIIRDDTLPARPRNGYSRLPELRPEDDSDMLDKVQMSELVVANLNEMMRTLTLPKRQVLSLEDDLFGGRDDGAAPQGRPESRQEPKSDSRSDFRRGPDFKNPDFKSPDFKSPDFKRPDFKR